MKQIKHMILLCLFCLTGIATQAQTGPANTEIWYTATSIVTPTNILGTDDAALTVNSNDYDESTGLGKITFSGDVITIGETAFKSKTLSSITIPASVTSIGKQAFYSCSKLATATFAEDCKLETIGEQAFNNCYVLSSITIPANVKSIGNSAFSGCSALSSITIPTSVTSIGNNAFIRCSELTTVTFAEGSNLETIGNGAFNNCYGLSSITIPANVTSIGNSAFSGCSDLSSITIPASVTSIGNSAFKNCYDRRNNNGLKTVTFAEGSKLTTIGDEAFNGCSLLSSPITIPANVTSIGNSAFYNCSKLASVTFAESSNLETIGKSAFLQCSVLSSITIPANVTSIGNSAFYSCTKLASVTFAENGNLDTIGESAFSRCSDLSSITIPESVTSIGTGVFWNCSALESISVDAENTDYSSPNDCNAIIKTATKTLIQGCKNTVIPKSVETIGESAFYGISTLESIAIPASVTSIGKSAFGGCSKLATVTFAEDSKLGTIGDEAFRLCSLLSSITIPASVKSIGMDAFDGCSKLATVTFAEDSKLETIGIYAFSNCSGLSSITIPAFVTSIGDYAFDKCYFTSLNIKNKDLADKAEEKKYWGALICDNDGLIIENNVLTKCAKWVTSVTIPASVTSIGDYAFQDCLELVKVTFAEGSKLGTIGKWAFSYCPVLSSITIPASVTSIGDDAFSQCSKLATVAFAEGSKLETIVSYAFNGCSALSSISIPASVTSIGNNAFHGCSGIESVTLNWTEADKIVTITNAHLQLQTGSTLLVPAGTEDLYATNESWSGFKDYMKPYITANQDPANKGNYYATFYSSSKAYQLPDGVTAYTGVVEKNTSNPDVSVLKLTPIADGIIPADEGVVLKLTSTDDTEAKVNFLVEESEAGTWSGTNALTGTDVKYTAAQYDYALSSGRYGVGFYPFWEKAIGVHKAYLTLGSAGAKAFIFQFDDATSIHNSQFIIHNSENDVMYNLNGVRVNDGYKGIVIKNGKKYYNK